MANCKHQNGPKIEVSRAEVAQKGGLYILEGRQQSTRSQSVKEVSYSETGGLYNV